MMTQTRTGHAEDCMCVPCLNADMMAHVATTNPASLRHFAGPIESGTAERTRYAQPGQACGSGVVRLVSDKQVAFIKRLMGERDTSKLVRLPGSENIEEMSLRGARDLIDRLLGCPELATIPTERPASDKQISFIKSLCERKGMADLSAHVTSAAMASKVVDRLLALADAPSAPQTSEPTEGLYRRADGRIVLTQRSKAGRIYGKIYDAETKSFAYERGAMSGELTRMTLDEAKDLSVEMGCCCRCGRELTATVDGVPPRDRFIGPICESRLA
jgi:hypothetical protein